MKKYVKILGIIIVMTIVLGLIYCFIDNNRIKKREEIQRNQDKITENQEEMIENQKEMTEKKEETMERQDEITENKEETIEKQDEITEKKEETIEKQEEITENSKESIENKKEIIETQKEVKENINSKVIVIDPGHQAKGNSEKESIGPGAEETKAKVTTGATGVVTKQKESELNLKVSLLLQEELSKKGYTVIMTRITNDVNMSNSERAHIANHAKADIFIRIHANSSSSSSAKGVLTMCQTEKNKYNGYLQQESYRLSKLVVDNISKFTGANNRGVTQTDNMSGINWCVVPTTIVEMGFLSNPEEDKLMETQDYQKKVVEGIVKGVEEYFVE